MDFFRKAKSDGSVSFNDYISSSVLEHEKDVEETIENLASFTEKKAAETPCLDHLHLERVNALEVLQAQLSVIFALERTDGLEGVGILKEKKEYQNHARILRETIAENIATLVAAVLIHAEEMISCVQFQSDKPAGQALGLFEHGYKLNECADSGELILYNKALRAIEAMGGDKLTVSKNFLEKYGVTPVFPNLGSTVKITAFNAKEELFNKLRLSEREKQLLRFTLKEFDRLEELTPERSLEFIDRFEKKSTKSGLDAMDALDMFAAIIFTLNTLELSSEGEEVEFEALFTLWRALDLHSDEIRQSRQAAVNQLDRRKNKNLISKHLMPINDLMEAINLPHDGNRAHFSKMLSGFIAGVVTEDQIIREFPAMKKFKNELQLMKEDL